MATCWANVQMLQSCRNLAVNLTAPRVFLISALLIYNQHVQVLEACQDHVYDLDLLPVAATSQTVLPEGISMNNLYLSTESHWQGILLTITEFVQSRAHRRPDMK